MKNFLFTLSVLAVFTGSFVFSAEVYPAPTRLSCVDHHSFNYGLLSIKEDGSDGYLIELKGTWLNGVRDVFGLNANFSQMIQIHLNRSDCKEALQSRIPLRCSKNAADVSFLAFNGTVLDTRKLNSYVDQAFVTRFGADEWTNGTQAVTKLILVQEGTGKSFDGSEVFRPEDCQTDVK